MACQTRSRAKLKVEKQNIRQARSNTKSTRQRAIGTAPGATHKQPLKKAKKRPVGLAASVAIGRTRERTNILPTLAAQVAQVPTTFNRLPTEIRLMIWEKFVRTPRIIHINGHNEPTEEARGYTCRFSENKRFSYRYPKKCEQICPLLGVNRESRYIALKAPDIDFVISYDSPKLRLFHENRIRRRFRIRAHDIVFFDGAETGGFPEMWTEGETNSITNIMIPLDVSAIDYLNPDARLVWLTMVEVGRDLVDRLKNTDSLQNVYCLFQDDTSGEPHAYDADKVREVTPQRLGQFPEYRRKDLTRWLEDFDEPILTCLYQDQVNKVKSLWKNVCMVG
ncbi:hypothetical protein F5Y03DRAFT_402170 [Xylaria venustula]|nr:hypothetical protein F5Y03DRAFT_402170 [Xylaria venustula]